MLSDLWRWLFTDPDDPGAARYRITVLIILAITTLLLVWVRGEQMVTRMQLEHLPKMVETAVRNGHG
jgi:hypothetical protein